MKKGFKILEFNDISAQIEKLHENGWDSGKYVGFDNVSKHYNMLPGSCTDWTGYPQSGKTELCLEFLLNTSEFYGWKHLLFVPDIGTSIEIMAKLIHKHTGKTFQKKYKNYIDIKTAFSACTILLENFKIIHKTDHRVQLSPIDVWEFAVDYAKKERLDSVLIDSWKDLSHDYEKHAGSYAKYLSSILPIRNEMAESSKLHFNTIIHPKSPVRNKDGKIRPPSADDMEGGAQWNNSGKSIIAVHRESLDENVSDIYFRKIKPEAVGRATSTAICLNFDVSNSRYYTLDPLTKSKIYGRRQQVEIEQKPLTPNVDFLTPKKEDFENLPF
jgi:hypothetical protein